MYGADMLPKVTSSFATVWAVWAGIGLLPCVGAHVHPQVVTPTDHFPTYRTHYTQPTSNTTSTYNNTAATVATPASVLPQLLLGL